MTTKNDQRLSGEENIDEIVVIGSKAIMQYLKMSRSSFYAFVKIGLPAKLINGRWYAHKENLRDYFKKITLPGPP